MSNSLSADEKKNLLSLLRRVDDPQALHHLLGDVGTQAALHFQMAAEELTISMIGEEEALEMGFEHIQAMSMTDASKRRLVSEAEDSGYGARAKQMPRPPCQVAVEAHAAAADRLSVPTDVLDIHDWGSTIMEVGKFASHRKSYLQLMTDPDREVVKYCQWWKRP